MLHKWLPQALFIAACIGLAWYTWSAWSEALPQYKNEALLLSSILLYIFMWPGSILVQLLHMVMQLVIPINDQFDMGNKFLAWILTTWAPLTIVGYLQWLVLIPRLARYWRGNDAGDLP
jgi:hypothetical protein